MLQLHYVILEINMLLFLSDFMILLEQLIMAEIQPRTVVMCDFGKVLQCFEPVCAMSC